MVLKNYHKLQIKYNLILKPRKCKHKAPKQVLGARTTQASSSALAILVQICAAAQRGKELAEGEYRSEGVVINKYTPSQPRHLSHSSPTAMTITMTTIAQHMKNPLRQEIMLCGRCRAAPCEHTAPTSLQLFQQLISTMTIENINNSINLTLFK